MTSAVAVESCSNLRCDEILVGEVEGSQHVTLLTQQVLLMVAVVRKNDSVHIHGRRERLLQGVIHLSVYT